MSERKTYGTTDLGAPVSRADLERALRNINANHVDTHDLVLELAAQVVALTDEIVRRDESISDAIDRALPERLEDIRVRDSQAVQRVDLDPDDDKYEVAPADLPCMELMPICKARCCRLRFSLSTRDLDEGVIRWDYGKPYQIRQRASDGYCVHNDPTSGGCTVHPQRPKVCRTYSCATDTRIWLDFEKRIIAPMDAINQAPPARAEPLDLLGRLRERRLARMLERSAIDETFAEDKPREGT